MMAAFGLLPAFMAWPHRFLMVGVMCLPAWPVVADAQAVSRMVGEVEYVGKAKDTSPACVLEFRSETADSSTRAGTAAPTIEVRVRLQSLGGFEIVELAGIATSAWPNALSARGGRRLTIGDVWLTVRGQRLSSSSPWTDVRRGEPEGALDYSISANAAREVFDAVLGGEGVELGVTLLDPLRFARHRGIVGLTDESREAGRACMAEIDDRLEQVRKLKAAGFKL
jgi:hypothetical protein